MKRKWKLYGNVFISAIFLFSVCNTDIRNFLLSRFSKFQICRNLQEDYTLQDISTQRWQGIEDSIKQFFFSAYYDRKTVNILGTIERRNNLILLCLFWYDHESFLSRVHAISDAIPEAHNKRYSAAFFMCKVPNKNIPKAVSLVTEKCQKPTNVIPVIHNTEVQRNFTVCVTPLNFKYSKGYQLVEMIELNVLLGADHFVFYNYSTDWNVDEILKYYQEMGLVTVIQWHLPMKVDTWPIKQGPVEIHYFGQLAMLNDCLHRNRGLSKYVVFQDLDEFIIPRQHNSWHDLMRSLPPNMASYMFRCTFFRLEWPDIEDSSEMYNIAKEYKAFTFLKQHREEKIFGKTSRSKYIVDPKLVQTVGIHNIWRLKLGHKPYYVPPDIALLHHYRSWNDHADKGKRIYDNRIINYKNALYKIEQTWKNIKHIPMGPL